MKARLMARVLGVVALVALIGGGVYALDTVIGETGIRLVGDRELVRSQETNLGNLVCDVLRYYTGADVAIYNGGGIRAPAELGDLTLENAMEILAFNNEVVTLELTGAQLVAALEHGVSAYGAASGRFLQVSGIRFFINPENPVGERVLLVYVNGAPLHPNKTYTLATNDFLAAGGDDYTMLGDAEEIAVADMTDQQMFIRYIQDYSPLFPLVEGRIIVW